MLAERAALAAEGYPPSPGAPWQGHGAARAAVQRTRQRAGTAIVPAQPHDFGDEVNGGQS